MTEEETARILLELRRIGVDLASLDEPLVGTGLRSSEVLGWLRAIPDAAGLGELLRRLDERNDVAQRNADRPIDVRWKPEPTRPAHRYQRERWWPTQRLLDAGTDLLLQEWDPFGIRLAGVDRESVAMFAFHFFGPLLTPNGRADAVGDTAALIASAEQDHLALRPSPDAHRRYLARRLTALVTQYPLREREAQARQAIVVAGGKPLVASSQGRRSPLP